MARYTGADCKRCRREKMKLFLKGAKCESPKCPIEIRPYPPGEHGRGRSKDSEYLLQLREKQKAPASTACSRSSSAATTTRPTAQGKTGENLLRILESRLDNVVYRAGFAKSRDMARQLVRHGHLTGQRPEGRHPVVPRERERHRRGPARARSSSRRSSSRAPRPASARSRLARGHPDPDAHPRHSLPARQVIDTPVQEQLIVELYSK